MYLRGLVPLNDRWGRKVSRHTCWIPFAPLLSELFGLTVMLTKQETIMMKFSLDMATITQEILIHELGSTYWNTLTERV